MTQAVNKSNEVETFLASLAQFGVGPLWKVLGKQLTPMPETSVKPHLWRWQDIRPQLLRSGELVTAALMNTYVKDNQTAMYAGAMSVTSQAAYDLLYASSATQLARIATDTSGKVMTAAGAGAPAWSW